MQNKYNISLHLQHNPPPSFKLELLNGRTCDKELIDVQYLETWWKCPPVDYQLEHKGLDKNVNQCDH